MTGDSDRVDGDLAVRSGVTIPARELLWRFSRSSGPGGQGVNTTDSRATVTWYPRATAALGPHLLERAIAVLGEEVSVSASDERSQYQNRLLARERLAARVRAAIAPPAAARRPTRPSRGAVTRRLDSKTRDAGTKRLRAKPGRDD